MWIVSGGDHACMMGRIMMSSLENSGEGISLGGKITEILEVFARFGRDPGHLSFS